MCPNPLALSHGQMPLPPGTTSGGRTVSPKIHGRGLRPGPATQPRLEARAPQTQPGSDAAAGDRTCPRLPPARGLRVRGGGRRNAASGRGAETHVPQTPRLRTDVAFHAFVVSSRGRQAIDVPSMF